ncbi:MAG: P-II family nitrogen regulator [Geobacter sp.]|nr:P-II family nitrogen regulator [Geobacter sp.]
MLALSHNHLKLNNKCAAMGLAQDVKLFGIAIFTTREATAPDPRRQVMKQIEAIIDQFRLHEVRGVLEEMGINDIMESTVTCRQKGQTMMFRGATFVSTIVEKVRLEIFAADEAVDRIIEAITASTLTGRREECRIAIHPCL